ncbi:MAG: tetratricopeptide repeat protein [Thermoplasmatota archaeon]
MTSVEVRNAREHTRGPASTRSKGCIGCGSDVEVKGEICKRCDQRRKWDVRKLTTPVLSLSIISMVLAFLILVNRQEISDSFDIDLSQRTDIGYLLVLLTIVSGIVFIWERRTSLAVWDAYRPILPVLGMVLIPLPVAIVLMDPTSMVSFLVLFLMLPVIGVVFVFLRKELLHLGLVSMTLLAVGSILSLYGVLFSIKEMDLTGFLWFLSGKHVSVLGSALLFIGSYLAFRDASIVSKAMAPVLFYCISAVMFVFLIIFIESGQSDVLDLLMVFPLLLMIISAASYMVECVNDVGMQRSMEEIEESLKRARDLGKRRNYFYALQQIDRAMRANPVSGFGRVQGTPNVIFDLEGPHHTEDFIFEPDEYEISMNEKGKILSSQGKFQEAMKEYQELIKRNPDFLEGYINLSMVLSSAKGRRKEAVKHIDYLIASKEVYIERWIRPGMPIRYVFWMADALREYRTMIDQKADMLNQLAKEGDVWAYFSLARY